MKFRVCSADIFPQKFPFNTDPDLSATQSPGDFYTDRYAPFLFESEYFDAADLPRTAASLFDDFERHPELARLVTWYRLEGGAVAMPEMEDANRAKIAAIARAQADGLVTDRFPPEVLLGLILVIATSWSDLPAGFEMITRDHTVAQRRGYVIDAVARLVSPEPRP